MAHHSSTIVYKRLAAALKSPAVDLPSPHKLGVLPSALPCISERSVGVFNLGKSVLGVQDAFRFTAGEPSPFKGMGLIVDSLVVTANCAPPSVMKYSDFTGLDQPLTLSDVVGQTDPEAIPESFFFDDAEESQWNHFKAGKNGQGSSASGHSYAYEEGATAFPDPLDRPRGITITAEGRSGASRFKHVIEQADGRLRRLVPDELDELNGFPRGFSAAPGISDTSRAFLMENASVVGVVRRIGQALVEACRAE